MSDPRPLIEHVGEILVKRETLIARCGEDQRETQLVTMGKSVLLLNLIRSLNAEANVPLESYPHHNKMFHFYSHIQDDMCGRARDITPIEIPSQLYAFEFLQEYVPQYNIKMCKNIHKNCVVKISDAPSSAANSLLITCREISQNQPITDLWIHKLHCDSSHAVPTDVFNMSETAQSVTIVNSILPCDLMEHFISQLPQCKNLRKLRIENIILYNSQSEQTSQEELSDTKMSAASSKTRDQVSKWELEIQTSNESHGNSLLSGDMLLFLSECRMLTHLNLSGNKLGKGGMHIVEIIDSLGLDSPLQLLYLRDCSIPTDTLRKMLKILRKCKQLTHLDLGGHNLENDGVHLVELLKSFGIDPPLHQLHLPNCSIQEKDCIEIFDYLSECRHLTHMNLNGNMLGKAGIHIVEMINRLGLDSPLQLLYLRNCSIPSGTLQEILKSLKKCKHLTHLDLGGNNLENDGEHIVELIKNVGKDPGLHLLSLESCLLPSMEVNKIVTHLSGHRQLLALDVSGNNVGNGLHRLIVNISTQTLRTLYLEDINMTADCC